MNNKIKKSLLSLLAAGLVVTSFSACRRPGLELLPEVKTTALMVVPNKDRVEVLDAATNRVIQTLKTDQRPNSIAASPDGRLILVTNTNSGTVSAFLRRDNDNFITLNSVGNGIRPMGVAFNPNANFSEAYVAYEGDGKSDGKLMVLDTRDKNSAPRITKVLSLPGSSPRKIAVNKAGDRLFVTDSQNGELIVITRTNSTFNRSAKIPLGTNNTSLPGNGGNSVSIEGIFIDDVNSRVYVANATTDSIVVVNTQNPNTSPQIISLRDNQIVGSNQVGPRNIAYYRNPANGQEKLYVTGYNASVISVIDAKQLRLIRNIPLSINTQGRESYNPVGIGVANSAGTDYVYVTNTSGLTLSLIDPNTDTLRRNTSSEASAADQSPLGEMITVGAVGVVLQQQTGVPGTATTTPTN